MSLLNAEQSTHCSGLEASPALPNVFILSSQPSIAVLVLAADSFRRWWLVFKKRGGIRTTLKHCGRKALTVKYILELLSVLINHIASTKSIYD